MLLPRIAKGCVITTNFDDAIEQTYRGVNIISRLHARHAGTQLLPAVWCAATAVCSSCTATRTTPPRTSSRRRSSTTAEAGPFDFHKPLPKALRAVVFVSQSLLFLGCSLEQDWTMELFGKAKTRRVRHPQPLRDSPRARRRPS